MFNKKLLMSHIENETNNDKMMRAGVSTPFYGNIEEKKDKKITKSHGKNYPKGTHMCATHVEHVDWGTGTPIHGQHAAPDGNGHISWYNVMFEHGTERINTSEVKVLGLVEHENHDHDGGDLTEGKKVSAPEGFHFMKHGDGKYKLMKNPEGGFKPHKGGSEEAEFPIQKVHEEKNCGCGQDPCKTYGKKNVEEQAEPTKLQIIMRSLSGRGSEGGEKTPGRGAEPTDHHEVGGKPRNADNRRIIATRYKSMKGYDPDARRADAIKSLKADRRDYI